jgi:outer membrane receptor protein involved in Fe transport
MSKVASLSITVLLLATPSIARAQDQEPTVQELYALSLEDLLSFAVSTGSFLDLDLRRSPMSMTIITREQLKVSGARDLSEALEIFVPGFQYMVNKWVGDIWGMRGTASDLNTKIIHLVNGINQTQQSIYGVFSETTLGLMGDVERIEVLRGPCGLVYGAGAISGVVNVVTRTPHKTSSEVTLGAGTFGRFEGEALTHNQISETQSLTLSAGFRRELGVGQKNSRIYGANEWPILGRPGSPYDNPTPFAAPGGIPGNDSAWSTPGNLRATLDYQLRNFRLYARLTRQQHTTGQYYVYDPYPEVTGMPPATAGDRQVEPGWTATPTNEWSYAEGYNTNRRLFTTDNLTVDGRYFFDVGEDRVDADLFAVGVSDRMSAHYLPGYQNGVVTPADATIWATGERRYQASARYLLKRVSDLQSAVGFEFRIDQGSRDLEGHNYFGFNDKIPFVGNATYLNSAVYNENHYQLTQFLAFEAGARFDKHTRTRGEISPKAAVILVPNYDHSIKAIFQSATKNGTIDTYEPGYAFYNPDGSLITQPYLTSTGNYVIYPSTAAERAAVKPERSLSYELTSTHQFFNHITVSPSASLTTIKDLQVWKTALFRQVNAGTYSFAALEADARGDWRGVQFGLSHAFQRLVSVDHGTQSVTVQKTNVVPDPNDPSKKIVVVVPGETSTLEFNSINDVITQDDKNFQNLATNISKLFVTFAPRPYLTFHTNLRLFWGLTGRKDGDAADAAQGFNNLDVATKPMLKWHASVSVRLPQQVRLSFFAYDILGDATSRNAVRWQQMAAASQKGYFTVDQRSFFLQLERDL